ncbi:hypothetical protein D3C71_1961120 [compost metagenome]
MGGRNDTSPRPLANQMTISLSRYMRDRDPTTDTNRLRPRMVGNWPNTVKPITMITSDGLTLPRDAWPRVRISIMVMTTVTSTTKVAPKLRASSLRMDESNNIG